MESKERFYKCYHKSGGLAAYAKISNIRTNDNGKEMGDIKFLNISNMICHGVSGILTYFSADSERIFSNAEIAKLKLLGL